jgi:hypothetical protein
MSTLAWFAWGFGVVNGATLGYIFRALTHKEVKR